MEVLGMDDKKKLKYDDLSYLIESPKLRYLMPTKTVEKLNDVELENGKMPIVIIHPIEGHVNMIKPWAHLLSYPIYGIQYTPEAMDYETVEELADYYWKQIKEEIFTTLKPMKYTVHLCGYSFGAAVAYEMACKQTQLAESLTFLNGSCVYTNPSQVDYESNTAKEEALYAFAKQYMPVEPKKQFVDQLLQLATFDKRVMYVVYELMAKSKMKFNPIDLDNAARSFVTKLTMSYKYKPKQSVDMEHVLLIKSDEDDSMFQSTYGSDYDIGKYYKGKIYTKIVGGDQRQFFNGYTGEKVAAVLNDYLTHF
jgi:pimeloyl-ACP methyl ester carboxylesterase